MSSDFVSLNRLELQRALSDVLGGWIPSSRLSDDEKVAASRIPGAVVGVVTSSGQRLVLTEGFAQHQPVKRAMHAGIWFDLASLTKVIFTAPRILALVNAGQLTLDTSLARIIPDFRQYDYAAWERSITIGQCLSHQSGLPAVVPLYTYSANPDTLRAYVLQHEWLRGENVYSDINFILLGIVLERLNGESIQAMNPGSGFAFSADPASCAATEYCTWRRRMLCGEVHDENCFAFQGAGHAGLFGTVDSVLDYALTLLKPNHQFSSIVDAMKSRQSDTRTLGWEIMHANWSGGQDCSETTIGHTGFTGTGLWVDTERGLAWTLLTNRVHPSRHTDSGIHQLRQQVGETVGRIGVAG